MVEQELTNEEIILRLDKIPELEKRMDRFENDLISLKKRINQCWNQIGNLIKKKE